MAPCCDALVAPIRQLLLERGATIIAKTVVDGRPCFKITLLNPDAAPADVSRMLDAVEAAADQLTAAPRTLPGTARQEARR